MSGTSYVSRNWPLCSTWWPLVCRSQWALLSFLAFSSLAMAKAHRLAAWAAPAAYIAIVVAHEVLYLVLAQGIIPRAGTRYNTSCWHKVLYPLCSHVVVYLVLAQGTTIPFAQQTNPSRDQKITIH